MPALRAAPCQHARGRPLLWVHKMDAFGKETYRYPARLLWESKTSATVAAVFQMQTMTVGGLRLSPGDCFVETYYRHRWYNILAIYDARTGRIRGWYANVGEPLTISPHTIAYRDLALDLVVLTDGRQVVLDADEFARLSLHPKEQQRAQQALQQLQARFRRCSAASA